MILELIILASIWLGLSEGPNPVGDGITDGSDPITFGVIVDDGVPF